MKTDPTAVAYVITDTTLNCAK